jgi:integrase
VAGQAPEYTPRERDTWTKSEAREFLAKASTDRLYVPWRLSLYGLRRGEVLGLCWSDIDLRARTLTVNQSRVLVEYRVRLEEPKSRNGKRTLPLDAELGTALTVLRKRQLDPDAHGARGRADLDHQQVGGHRDSAFTQKTYVRANEEDLQRAGPRSPGFTRSLRTVRNCETPGPKPRVQLLGNL